MPPPDHHRGSRRREAAECKALLDAASKDLFRKNAFRITGLTVDATTREITRFGNQITQLVELGHNPPSQTAAFPITPPPSVDDIREALQRLRNPEKRLIDEFFWFWPEKFGSSQSDLAMQALASGNVKRAIEIWLERENDGPEGVVAKHNLAVAYHLSALDWDNHAVRNRLGQENRQLVNDYWELAFARWEVLATHEAFWETVTARIRQMNEPGLTTGFARRMQTTLPEALDKINAELAIAFAESGQINLTIWHIQFMRQTHQGLDNVEKIAEMVLTPARNQLKEYMRTAEERAHKNPREAAEAARELLKQAQQTLTLFDLFFEKDSDIRGDVFDEVARLCNQLPLLYYNETGDDKTCLEILHMALPFASSIEWRQQIETHIVLLTVKSIQKSDEPPPKKLEKLKNEVLSKLQVVESILAADPEAHDKLCDFIAIVLREISLDSWNKHEDVTTAWAAHELAIKYARMPELKRRLSEDALALTQIKLLAPFVPAARRQNQKSSGSGCLVMVAMVLFIGIVLMASSWQSTPSKSNSQAHPFSIQPQHPRLPVTSSAGSHTPVVYYNNETWESSSYRVPRSLGVMLSYESSAIETDRARLESLERQLKLLDQEIERERIFLDRSNQSAVDAFNAKVRFYNALVQQSQIAASAYNQKVREFNAKLKQYGR